MTIIRRGQGHPADPELLQIFGCSSRREVKTLNVSPVIYPIGQTAGASHRDLQRVGMLDWSKQEIFPFGT